MSRKERLQTIIQSMDIYYYQYGGIQIVVIDGVADWNSQIKKDEFYYILPTP